MQIHVVSKLGRDVGRHVGIVEERVRIVGGALLRFLLEVVIRQVRVGGGNFLPKVSRQRFERVLIWADFADCEGRGKANKESSSKFPSF